MFRTALILAALWLATAGPAAATAACGEADLIAELPEADRQRLAGWVAAHPYPEGNLWRAEKPGSRVTVVGTLHIPDPRLDAIVARVEPDLRAADMLIIEATAETEARVAAMAAEQPDMFFLNEGPSLIDLLGPEDWARAEERLAALGIPGFVGARFQPWYMSLTLALPPCALKLIQSGERGLDRRLEAMAIEAGVELAELDDIESFLRLFADEPLEKQLDALRLTLRSDADPNATVATFIKAYFEGRVREAWEFTRIQVERAGIENGEELFEEVNAVLLDGRNRAWEAKLADLVRDRDAVIAVGAAHLSGETGVLRALERLGYGVSRL